MTQWLERWACTGAANNRFPAMVRDYFQLCYIKLTTSFLNVLINSTSIEEHTGPVHGISVLIAYAQMLLINAHYVVSSNARGLNFGPRLHLHPYFVYASSEGSGESAHMHRLA